MEELEIGDYINDINSYHLHMFDKHDVTTKKLDVIVEKAGKVDANYAAQIEGYCSLLGEYGKKFETVCAMLALDLIRVIPVIGALKYLDEIGTLFKNADKVSVVARSTDGAGVLAKHADEAAAWQHGGKVFRYSDETAEAVASGEKLLKESGTIYESFADMMSPEDAKRYLDFLENGSREGLTSAELAGVEKADALLVSQKVEYEDVWDLRNAGDLLETSYGKSREIIQCNTKDAAADELAKRIGGQSRSAFADDPIQREFDVISDQYIAQAKPPLKCVNKTVRTQMKATFEAAKKYERKVYYQFEGIPSQEVLDKLYEYSERYGVEVIIDTEPLGILN